MATEGNGVADGRIPYDDIAENINDALEQENLYIEPVTELDSVIETLERLGVTVPKYRNQ